LIVAALKSSVNFDEILNKKPIIDVIPSVSKGKE